MNDIPTLQLSIDDPTENEELLDLRTDICQKVG